MKKKLKKQDKFFVDNYVKVWKYFKESRWYVIAALVLFFAFFSLGFMFPIFFSEKIIELMEKLSQSIEGLGPLELILYIFWNNLRATFFAIVFGVALGIFPVFTGMLNGYVAGFVSRRVSDVEGIGVLWRLAPHGIFEIPAILLAIGIGIKLGVGSFGKGAGEKIKHNFIESMRFFVFVIFPLLVIAAIIEGLLISFMA